MSRARRSSYVGYARLCEALSANRYVGDRGFQRYLPVHCRRIAVATFSECLRAVKRGAAICQAQANEQRPLNEVVDWTLAVSGRRFFFLLNLFFSLSPLLRCSTVNYDGASRRLALIRHSV